MHAPRRGKRFRRRSRCCGGAGQIREAPFSTGIPRGMAVEAGPLTELEGLHLKRYVVITEA